MKKFRFLVLFISMALALSACGNKDRKVLARINDEVITLEEFNNDIERLPKHYQDMIVGQKKKFLDEIIKEELLYKEALKSNIDKDAETQELIAEARKKILVSSLIKSRVDNKAFLSEDDLREYYDQHSEEFMLPERWRASHIVVDTPEEAREIREKLNEGVSFEELAENRSKDATAKEGGDIGYFSKGQLIPEFQNACFELKIGQISDVVETPFGYHVIKLTDKKNPEVQEFSSVKELIRKELERTQKRELLDELITDLRNDAKITINEELIEETPEEKK